MPLKTAAFFLAVSRENLLFRRRTSTLLSLENPEYFWAFLRKALTTTGLYNS